MRWKSPKMNSPLASPASKLPGAELRGSALPGNRDVLTPSARRPDGVFGASRIGSQMPTLHKLRLFAILSFCGAATPLMAQDLAPRAYFVTPVHSNAVVLT